MSLVVHLRRLTHQLVGALMSAKRPEKSALPVVSCFVAIAIGLIGTTNLHAGEADGQLRVMTYNVNEGTDYIELLNAKTLPQVLIAVGQTITQVRATNPPERMPAVAAQILTANPTLVTLQEVDRSWISR